MWTGTLQLAAWTYSLEQRIHSMPVLPISQDELAKCKRSITKRLPEAPHEVLLVLDGTTGLNMLNQAREWGHSSWGWCDSRGMVAWLTTAADEALC